MSIKAMLLCSAICRCMPFKSVFVIVALIPNGACIGVFGVGL